MKDLTIAERVALGAAFLDKHFTGWWERIDLGTLNIDDCDSCVLGQLWCTAPQEEAGQIVAQSVGRLMLVSGGALDRMTATEVATNNNPYATIVQAYEELRGTGSHKLGFNFGANFITHDDEPEALADEWTRLIIQRRLDASPYVVGGVFAEQILVAV